MSKNTKKMIVNGLTFSRVITTMLMPILFTIMSAPYFMVLIGAILFTDFLDGQLARRWNVCTLFGSLSDMGADKLFGISLLIVLAFSYPIMIIPACLEIGIASVNTKSVLKGNKAKSSLIGKTKMWVMGISMASLLMIGASPEINNLLSNSNGTIKEFIKTVTSFFTENKIVIENTVIPATIVSETATLIDYIKDYDKVKDNESKKLLEELKRYKEYIKDYNFKKYMEEIMLNEEYHKKTQDEPLIKKLMPNKNKVVDK